MQSVQNNQRKQRTEGLHAFRIHRAPRLHPLNRDTLTLEPLNPLHQTFPKTATKQPLRHNNLRTW